MSNRKRKRSRIPFWFADQIPGYPADPANPVRKRLRRKDLAENFRVNIRTIDHWWKVAKFLPPPHYVETM
jgi:hypothetical protein